MAKGREKWERKTANAGSKWKANTSGKGEALRAGLQRAGFSAGPQFMSSWESGVSAVSAADFDSAIAGKGAKWETNTAAGIAR